ncbi:DUF4136 domain-containing protein [Oceanicoccus sp. KOV_DT_Chl]|uniref:DUF4136 domain-containing protein n=1 Tax=Oceanicoccus sp. KOV_DT_Chl TaxID=1904639 RepID=UPI000C79E5DB|nr:DUF4136 domain-containing protein [Oceanicoccus sp. KOV_DT_Chl]
MLQILKTVFLVMLIAACANGPELNYDYLLDRDYSLLKTYRWYDDVYSSKEAEYRSYNASDKRVRTYIDRELIAKGYRLLNEGKSDFLINYHISKQERYSNSQFNDYYDRGMHGAVSTGTMGTAVAVGYSSGNNEPRTYKEGTVVIDILATADNKIIWRGIAEGRLPKELSQAKRNHIANELAKEMLAEFPPK